MLDQALNFFSALDLTPALMLLCFIGALCSIYLMQLTHYESEDSVDPLWIRRCRRVSLAGLAMAMCWTVYYAGVRTWQPWPPILFLVAMIVLLLTIRIFAIKARIRRTGTYLQSPAHIDIVRSKRPTAR